MSDLKPDDLVLQELKTLNRTMHRIRALLRLCTGILIGLLLYPFDPEGALVGAAIGWVLLCLFAWKRGELSQPD